MGGHEARSAGLRRWGEVVQRRAPVSRPLCDRRRRACACPRSSSVTGGGACSPVFMVLELDSARDMAASTARDTAADADADAVSECEFGASKHGDTSLQLPFPATTAQKQN